MIDGVVQEVDIQTGKVLFQWNSEDHVPYSQSEQPLPASASTPWDWFHINAVKLDTDGNLLVDARDTWTTYKVSLQTGSIIWQLGGKASSFKLQAAPGQTLDNAGEIFAWQHDPEALGGGLYSWFDNESAGTPELSTSRAVVVRLNTRNDTATLVASYDQPEGLVAASQGNAQTTAQGNLVVGWGALPYFSEFSPSRPAPVQRPVPDGRQHLPGLPAAVPARVPVLRAGLLRIPALEDRRGLLAGSPLTAGLGGPLSRGSPKAAAPSRHPDARPAPAPPS